jgi:hypothetical protein
MALIVGLCFFGGLAANRTAENDFQIDACSKPQIAGWHHWETVHRNEFKPVDRRFNEFLELTQDSIRFGLNYDKLR